MAVLEITEDKIGDMTRFQATIAGKPYALYFDVRGLSEADVDAVRFQAGETLRSEKKRLEGAE